MPTQTELLRDILDAFPQADPASEFYDQEINGCDAVNFLSQIIPEVRKCLDAPPPRVAVVIQGGIIQCITSDRPGDVLPQAFIVVDYDTDYSAEEETIKVPQGDEEGTVSDAFAAVLEVGQAKIDLDAVFKQLEAE